MSVSIQVVIMKKRTWIQILDSGWERLCSFQKACRPGIDPLSQTAWTHYDSSHCQFNKKKEGRISRRSSLTKGHLANLMSIITSAPNTRKSLVEYNLFHINSPESAHIRKSILIYSVLNFWISDISLAF